MSQANLESKLLVKYLPEANGNRYVDDEGYTRIKSVLKNPEIQRDYYNKPINGACLRFDNSNPEAYLTISDIDWDSLGDNYKVVIKGEGGSSMSENTMPPYRGLYYEIVHGGWPPQNTIEIHQLPNSSDNDYFILSYIAIINVDTNKVIHLFNFDGLYMSSQNIYHDSTGQHLTNNKKASCTVDNITSASSLYVNSPTKEWIQNEYNLMNAVQLTHEQSVLCSYKPIYWTNIPFPLSYAFKVRYPKNLTNTNRGVFNWSKDSGNSNDTYSISCVLATNGQIVFRYNNGKVDQNTIRYTPNNDNYPDIRDGKWHNIIYTINDTTINVYIDDFYHQTLSASNTGIGDANSATFRLWSSQTLYARRTTTQYQLSDILIVNWDMSNESSLYTVNDYIMGKDVPQTELLNGNIYFWSSNVGGDSMYDGSINRRHLFLRIDPSPQYSKSYGSFYNNVGGDSDRPAYSRKILV